MTAVSLDTHTTQTSKWTDELAAQVDMLEMSAEEKSKWKEFLYQGGLLTSKTFWSAEIHSSTIKRIKEDPTFDATAINRLLRFYIAIYTRQLTENLAYVRQEENFWAILFSLYRCFSDTEKYFGHHGEKEGVQFALDVHQAAFKLCRLCLEKLVDGEAKSQARSLLCYLANHPQMDLYQQDEILKCRIQLATTDYAKASAYSEFIWKAHINKTVQDEAMRALFEIAANKGLKRSDRKKALEHLPHLPHYTEIAEQTRAESVRFLTDRIQDHTENPKFRLFCAEQLARWVWTRLDSQTALLPSQEVAMLFLEQFIDSAGDEELKQKTSKCLLHLWGYNDGPAQNYLTTRKVAEAKARFNEEVDLENLTKRVLRSERIGFIECLQFLAQLPPSSDQNRLALFLAAKQCCRHASHFVHLFPRATGEFLVALASIRNLVNIDTSLTFAIDCKKIKSEDLPHLQKVVEYVRIKFATLNACENALLVEQSIPHISYRLALLNGLFHDPLSSRVLYFRDSEPEYGSVVQDTLRQSRSIQVLEIDLSHYPVQKLTAQAILEVIAAKETLQIVHIEGFTPHTFDFFTRAIGQRLFMPFLKLTMNGLMAHDQIARFFKERAKECIINGSRLT